ncbi:MAG: histidine-type phosphatase [Coriobacteriales bacterium]|nr:histidine-type phosphatase [Coriobacteriales bacterium]
MLGIRAKHSLALLSALCSLVLLLVGCGGAQVSASSASVANQETSASGFQEASYQDPGEGYTLKQVVVLSRHNIRAPLSTGDSVLAKATPHEWIDWTAAGSELTLRGGAQETMMGQHFRKWLAHEGLMPENYRPQDGDVRFYANGKQRTIATAQYFSSGMLPVANVNIEVHAAYDEMDPVFNPQITYLSDAYQSAAQDQISQMTKAVEAAGEYQQSCALIQDVLDYTKSKGYQSGELKDLDPHDMNVVLELNKEPAATGSLKLACQLSDALVLQYYESPSAKDAAFGTELTDDQWKTISCAKDTYGSLLFSAPLVATNVAHPLLQEIGSELDANGRKFTFLCGHDSNIASVLAALGVQEYELEGAIESDTPIGGKLLFEKWENEKGERYGRVRLIYQSVSQLRSGSMLSGYEVPASQSLSFEGLSKNADGLYAYDELRAHIQAATDAYDELAKTFGEPELAQAA